MARLFGVRRKKRQQKNTPATSKGKAKGRASARAAAKMPPMVSDDETDDERIPDAIPAKGKIPTAAADGEDEEMAEEEEEAEEEDGEEEDEFVVEKILSHDYSNGGGVLIYQIKWKGYDSKKDMTWEPVENLDGAKDLLKAYHAKIGGPPADSKPSTSTKKPKTGKRTAADAFADSPSATTTTTTKNGRRSTNGEAKPRELPIGSWEEHVTRIVSILEESVAAGKGGRKGRETKELIGLVQWNDEDVSKTQHPMRTLRQRCPQRLLDYYEQHLKFQTDDD